jgi:hypothetical protein
VLAEKKRVIAALAHIVVKLWRRSWRRYAMAGHCPTNLAVFECLAAFVSLDSSFGRLCYWFHRAWVALYTSGPRAWRGARAAFLHDGGALPHHGYGPRSALNEAEGEDGDERTDEPGSEDEDEAGGGAPRTLADVLARRDADERERLAEETREATAEEASRQDAARHGSSSAAGEDPAPKRRKLA